MNVHRRNGQIEWRCLDVEIYDSPTKEDYSHLDSDHALPKELNQRDIHVGLCKAIRRKLNVSLSQPIELYFRMHKRGNVEETTHRFSFRRVHQTDKRLTSGGICEAAATNNHCWMNAQLRGFLGINEEDNSVIADDRAHLESFQEMYGQIDIGVIADMSNYCPQSYSYDLLKPTLFQVPLSSHPLVQRASYIVQQIELGGAHTCYSHRPQYADKHGNIEPFVDAMGFLSCSRDSAKPVCEVFGAPGLPIHIISKGRYRIAESGVQPELPRYFVDCAGFIRNLLKSVPESHRALAEVQDFPDDVSVFTARSFPRAHRFVSFFRSLSSSVDTDFSEESHGDTPSKITLSLTQWRRVANFDDVKPGDILAFTNAPKDGVRPTHTGHIVLCVGRTSSDEIAIIESRFNHSRDNSDNGTGAGGVWRSTLTRSHFMNKCYVGGRIVGIC